MNTVQWINSFMTYDHYELIQRVFQNQPRAGTMPSSLSLFLAHDGHCCLCLRPSLSWTLLDPGPSMSTGGRLNSLRWQSLPQFPPVSEEVMYRAPIYVRRCSKVWGYNRGHSRQISLPWGALTHAKNSNTGYMSKTDTWTVRNAKEKHREGNGDS